MSEIRRQLEVTPISTLKDYAKGELVQFPDFAEGQPFVARVKRPSMLVLMRSGKIPNKLMATATSLFNEDLATPDEDFFPEMLDILDIVAEASFIQPTWGELKDAGIELTDEQLIFLFSYSQKGVKALEPFREEQESVGGN